MILLSGVYVETNWGWSFMVPGLIIAFFGVVNWFFLVPNPQYVGIDNETVSFFCLKYDNFCTKRSLSSQYIYIYIFTIC